MKKAYSCYEKNKTKVAKNSNTIPRGFENMELVEVLNQRLEKEKQKPKMM